MEESPYQEWLKVIIYTCKHETIKGLKNEKKMLPLFFVFPELHHVKLQTDLF